MIGETTIVLMREDFDCLGIQVRKSLPDESGDELARELALLGRRVVARMREAGRLPPATWPDAAIPGGISDSI